MISHKAYKILPTLWRHLFKLIIFSLYIMASLGAYDWFKNVGFLFFMGIAANIFDRYKMGKKYCNNVQDPAHLKENSTINYHRINNNPNHFGSAAWMANSAIPGSPAYNLNQLGHSSFLLWISL